MENGGDDGNMKPTQYHISSSKSMRISSHYREIQKRINEGEDDLAEASSDKFTAIMKQVEQIHQHVSKPREQVADAEALLKLTNILMTSVKSHSTAGVTPVEFVSILIRKFGLPKNYKGFSHNVLWADLGSRVSPIFMKGSGCRTMIGPVENELKKRKVVVHAKRKRSGYMRTLPKEVKITAEMISDTDKNISLMFEILKTKKRAKLESLILNRYSFAQTIENLFALSFLVKDGRVHIKVEEDGSHVIAPRNGPSAAEIKSGAAKSHHFMFRFDFNDWKLMKRCVGVGEELMAQRYAFDMSSCCDGNSDIPEGIPVDFSPNLFEARLV